MSTVPYIFANQYGNIALSELDANFANVKANVDYADTSAQSIVSGRATYVTANAQANITSLGTLSSLTVSGTFTGNLISVSTANITNVTVSGTTTVEDIYANSVITNSISSDDSTTVFINDGLEVQNNLTVDGQMSAVGNITTGATVNGANVRGNTAVINNGLTIIAPFYHAFTTNANLTLSNTTSLNVFFPQNPGLTLTLNMPTPIANGQVTQFTFTGNTVTLIEGTVGNLSAGFAGAASAGNSWQYVYRQDIDKWFKY